MDMKAMIEGIGKVKKAIQEKHPQKGFAKGTIPCPVCQKNLFYSRAASNGHVHARCETPDCICFME